MAASAMYRLTYAPHLLGMFCTVGPLRCALPQPKTYAPYPRKGSGVNEDVVGPFIFCKKNGAQTKKKDLHETIVREPAANPKVTRKSNTCTNPSETMSSTKKTEAQTRNSSTAPEAQDAPCRPQR